MWENNQRVIYYNKNQQVRLIGTIVNVSFNDIGGNKYDLVIEWDGIGGTYIYRDVSDVMNYLSPYEDLPERNPNKAFKREKKLRR